MFKFRLLLFFIGIIALLLLTPSTDSQGYGYGSSYPSEHYGGYGMGYGYAAPSYPQYGSYAKPSYGGSYSASCNYMKVIEVLDQIFCSHIEKRRYSSTIYPYIEVIIDQIQYTSEYVFIPSVFDYIIAAQHELETLNDAVYGIYYDSSLLKSYNEYDCDDCSTSQTQGAGGAQVQGSPSRANAQMKTNENKQKVQTNKARAQIFMNQNSEVAQEVIAMQTSQHTKTVVETVVVDVKQRSTRSGNLTNLIADPSKGKKVKRGLQNLLKLSLADRKVRSAGARKPRSSEYSDYTCSYIPYAYCDDDKYDELLYNILTRIWTALDFLDAALEDTWSFMMEIGCDDLENRWALIEASIIFGSIVTEFYFLVEIEDYIERMYELIELDYGDETYYRSGGGSSDSSSSIPVPQYSGAMPYPQPVRRPVPVPVPVPYSKSPMPIPYPFGGYMAYSVPQSPPPPPQPYQQSYRQTRAPQTPLSVPAMLVVG